MWTGRVLVTAAAMAAAIGSSHCAARLAPPKPASAGAKSDFGIPACRAGAERDLLSTDALQCWFNGRYGHWRTLNHQSHLEALVVEIEARDVRDAAAIAQRVVSGPAGTQFSEILVYVAQPAEHESRIRRVRWTRGGGFETMDYTTAAGEAPLTIRSSPTP